MLHLLIAGFFFDHWLWHPLVGLGYQFWSGIEPDITQLAIVGGVATMVAGFWHQHNCHVQGCYRLQFHPHPDHGHPVCRHHFGDDVKSLEDH